MKRSSAYFLLIAILFNACSPKLRYTISAPQPALNDNDDIVVIPETEPASFVDGTRVGTLFSGDNGFSVNCFYKAIMDNFVSVARKNGANIIKIIKHEYPDGKSTCDRVTVELYRVSNPQTYEKEIEWSNDRKLSWADFKGMPDIRSKYSAETSAKIKYHTNYVSIISKPKIFTSAVFYCSESWAKPSQATKLLLEHEQGHFNLCEVYRRKLEKDFVESKLSFRNFSGRINELLNKYNTLYEEIQVRYDEETNHGLNAGKQQEWTNSIAKDLSDLENYKQ